MSFVHLENIKNTTRLYTYVVMNHSFVEPYRFSRDILPDEMASYNEYLKKCQKCGLPEEQHVDKYLLDDGPKCTKCGVSSLKHGYLLHKFEYEVKGMGVSLHGWSF